MNEQSLVALDQFDFKVYKTIRARGGFLCNTSKGVVLLCECTKPDSFYERENKLTEQLKENTEFLVDSYEKSLDGALLVENEENKYYVKRWTMGREFNTDSLFEVENAARLMAKMHLALNSLATEEADCSQLLEERTRHTRELKSIFNYLKAKKGKNTFELALYKCFNEFYEETKEFEAKVSGDFIKDLPTINQLCHGSFNHHNVLLDQAGEMIVNFDKVKGESNMVDLYCFMRKILEKQNWNISLAYRIIECYDSVKSIEKYEQRLLAGLFTYPEKFWKIANYYYNNSKAWVPEKNTTKLCNLINQNENRKRFVKTLG